MNVSWGGINFYVPTVTESLLEPIYTPDNGAYLFHHLMFSCRAILNPNATSLPGPGNSPSTTSVLISQILAQPRQQLLVTVDDGMDDNQPTLTLYQSPLPGYVCDSRGGPLCVVNGIEMDHGNGSMMCDLTFHTWFNQCAPSVNNYGGSPNAPPQVPNPILSNRWSYQVTYNQENFAEVRVFAGQAIFRMDALIAMNLEADYARGYLVFPLLPGYERRAPLFELSELGDAIRYIITDTQMSMSFPYGNQAGIANISIVEGREYYQPGSLQSLVAETSTLTGAVKKMYPIIGPTLNVLEGLKEGAESILGGKK